MNEQEASAYWYGYAAICEEFAKIFKESPKVAITEKKRK